MPKKTLQLVLAVPDGMEEAERFTIFTIPILPKFDGGVVNSRPCVP